MIYTGCGAECTKLQDDFVWHVKENDRHLKVTHRYQVCMELAALIVKGGSW